MNEVIIYNNNIKNLIISNKNNRYNKENAYQNDNIDEDEDDEDEIGER